MAIQRSGSAPAKKQTAQVDEGPVYSAAFQGDDVFAEGEKAIQESQSRFSNSPYNNRFWMPLSKVAGPGQPAFKSKAEIIILDNKITAAYYEHELSIPGRKNKEYVICIGSIPGKTCPLCASGDQKRYRLFLTVLELVNYTPKAGGPPVTQKKRLLPINQGDMEKWKTIQQDVLKEHSTLRGTYIALARGTNQQSSRIGDTEVVAGRGWQHMDEQELVSSYGHPARFIGSGPQRKQVAAANEELIPYDYVAEFPKITEKYCVDLQNRFGNGKGLPSQHDDPHEGHHAQGVGSAQDIQEAWENSIEQGADDPMLVDFTGMGEIADGGDVPAQQTLTEIATQFEIDVQSVETWAEVEMLLVEAGAGIPPEEEAAPTPPPVAKKAAAKKAAPLFAKKTANVAPTVPTKVATKVALTFTKAPTKVAIPAKKVATKQAPPSGLIRPNRSAFGG